VLLRRLPPRARGVVFTTSKGKYLIYFQHVRIIDPKNVVALSKICNKFAPFSEKKNQIEENDAGTVAVEVAHRFYGLHV
jgi:hypothetical protein